MTSSRRLQALKELSSGVSNSSLVPPPAATSSHFPALTLRPVGQETFSSKVSAISLSEDGSLLAVALTMLSSSLGGGPLIKIFSIKDKVVVDVNSSAFTTTIGSTGNGSSFIASGIMGALNDSIIPNASTFNFNNNSNVGLSNSVIGLPPTSTNLLPNNNNNNESFISGVNGNTSPSFQSRMTKQRNSLSFSGQHNGTSSSSQQPVETPYHSPDCFFAPPIHQQNHSKDAKLSPPINNNNLEFKFVAEIPRAVSDQVTAMTWVKNQKLAASLPCRPSVEFPKAKNSIVFFNSEGKVMTRLMEGTQTNLLHYCRYEKILLCGKTEGQMLNVIAADGSMCSSCMSCSDKFKLQHAPHAITTVYKNTQKTKTLIASLSLSSASIQLLQATPSERTVCQAGGGSCDTRGYKITSVGTFPMVGAPRFSDFDSYAANQHALSSLLPTLQVLGTRATVKIVCATPADNGILSIWQSGEDGETLQKYSDVKVASSHLQVASRGGGRSFAIVPVCYEEDEEEDECEQHDIDDCINGNASSETTSRSARKSEAGQNDSKNLRYDVLFLSTGSQLQCALTDKKLMQYHDSASPTDGEIDQSSSHLSSQLGQWTIANHTGGVSHIAANPRNGVVVSSDAAGTLFVWQIRKNSKVNHLKTLGLPTQSLQSHLHPESSEDQQQPLQLPSDAFLGNKTVYRATSSVFTNARSRKTSVGSNNEENKQANEINQRNTPGSAIGGYVPSFL
eukprot:GDKJ01042992.1.p1 GENE.GDKJ01042992.1~~GDKJ01042992.1.p1  ORF type:complete len:747 (+),score=180.59 GDKJ01042992.1:44-2242(+)